MQVQIRHQGGDCVTLDDCAQFSGPMGEAIDKSDLLKENYVLEVSSPGLSNHLKTDQDFETFKGFPIEVVINEPDQFKSKKTGLLHSRTNDHISINNKGKISKIPISQVIEVQLISPTG